MKPAPDRLITSYWHTSQSVARMAVIGNSRRKSQVERTAVNREMRNHSACPAIEASVKIGNELRLVVVSCLIHGPMRFNELLDTARGVDPRSLSRVLKYLGTEGILDRHVLSTQPIAVQYSLTEKGRQLEPVVDALRVWGRRWIMPQEAVPTVPARPR